MTKIDRERAARLIAQQWTMSLGICAMQLGCAVSVTLMTLARVVQPAPPPKKPAARSIPVPGWVEEARRVRG